MDKKKTLIFLTIFVIITLSFSVNAARTYNWVRPNIDTSVFLNAGDNSTITGSWVFNGLSTVFYNPVYFFDDVHIVESTIDSVQGAYLVKDITNVTIGNWSDSGGTANFYTNGDICSGTTCLSVINSTANISGEVTTGYVPYAVSKDNLIDSPIYTDGVNVGIKTTTPDATLHTKGSTIDVFKVQRDSTTVGAQARINFGISTNDATEQAFIAAERVDADSADIILYTDAEVMRATSDKTVAIGLPAAVAILTTRATTAFNTDSTTFTGDGLFLDSENSIQGKGNYGAGISFGKLDGQARRRAGISIVQTETDPDMNGLAFFTHSSISDADPLVEAVRITHDKKLGVNNQTPEHELSVNGDSYVSGDSTVKENFVVDGNFSAKRAYISVSSNESQIAVIANTAYVMNFSHIEDDFMMGLENAENITVEDSGDYIVTLSGIFVTDTNNKHFNMWPQTTHADGVTFANVPRSNTKIEVENAGTHGLIAVSFMLDLNSGDKVRIMYASDDAGSMTVWTAGSGVGADAIPETPSMIMTISKHSEITE